MEQAVSSAIMPTYARLDLTFEKGEGAYLFTEDGDKYLDFGAGIAVSLVGHSHPDLIAALKAQAEKLWHTSNLYHIPGQRRLAERLTENSFADLVFFCNSGMEAVEGSMKLARKYHSANGNPERYRIITVEGAFHGRSFATLAAGNQAKHLDGFGPKMEGFDQIPRGDLEAAKAAITHETAAILVEPIQGEGGIYTFDADFIKGLRDLCDENGLLLIFDEIQTGMGRTGKLWAHEVVGVTPDVMASAKGLGGGFPIGAFLATAEAAKGMVAGTHGTTYGGNPLGCAVANAVLDIVTGEGFLDQVKANGDYLEAGLNKLAEKHHNKVAEVRGLGMMRGLICRGSNIDLVKKAQEHKLLLVPAGDNAVRLLPPLVVTKDEIDQALDLLDQALGEV